MAEERSNDKLLQKWLADHPGEKAASFSVKKGLGEDQEHPAQQAA